MNATVYFGTHAVHKAVSQPGLIVPESALRRINQKEAVWVASDGKVSSREVVTLAQRPDRVVVQGLAGTENIVVSSSQNLNEGDAIRIRPEKSCA